MIRLSFAQSRGWRRPLAALTAAILLCTLAGIGMTLAQGNTPGKIKIGDTVTGTLDAKNFAQAYALDGKNGDKITITATSKTTGLSLALILAGPAGNIISQNAQLTSGSVSMSNVTLPADGQYLITVLRGTGAQGNAQGNFTLAITGAPSPTPVSGSVVALPQGMSVNLSWNSADDLSLEVRDPIGGDVNWRNPSSNGGSLDNNTNADCSTATANNPNESVNWPGGNVTAGSYEVIVYFNKTCAATQPTQSAPSVTEAPATVESVVPLPTIVPSPTEQTAPLPAATQAATAQGDAPALMKFNPNGQPALAQNAGVSFAVTITINGEAQDPIRSTLQLNQQYVASFLLTSPTSVTVKPGGPNLAIDLQPFEAKTSAPTALGNRTSVTGTINGNNAADAWSFDLSTSRSITIAMNASSGSLDPFLVLLGSDGTVLASNDDASDTTRDSVLTNQLLKAGRYTVVATRFALALGGTEGNYTLTIGNKVAGSTTSVPLPTAVGGTTASGTSATPQGALPTGSIQVLLTWNSRADMRLLIRDPNGASVYSDSPSPANSGILDRQGNFKCTNTTTTPVTYAYWPTNQIQPGTYEVGVWLDNRCQDTGVLPTYTLTITVNGKQVGSTIKDRPDPSINKDHTLTTFTTDANGNATMGPVGIFSHTNFVTDVPDIANQLSSAVSLTLGTPATGTINTDTPIILYTFTANAKQRIVFDLKQSSGNLDPDMFLLDSTGKQIDENDDETLANGTKDRNSHIDHTFNVQGTYVIVATRYGARLGGTSGGFELDTVVR